MGVLRHKVGKRGDRLKPRVLRTEELGQAVQDALIRRTPFTVSPNTSEGEEKHRLLPRTRVDAASNLQSENMDLLVTRLGAVEAAQLAVELVDALPGDNVLFFNPIGSIFSKKVQATIHSDVDGGVQNLSPSERRRLVWDARVRANATSDADKRESKVQSYFSAPQTWHGRVTRKVAQFGSEVAREIVHPEFRQRSAAYALAGASFAVAMLPATMDHIALNAEVNADFEEKEPTGRVICMDPLEAKLREMHYFERSDNIRTLHRTEGGPQLSPSPGETSVDDLATVFADKNIGCKGMDVAAIEMRDTVAPGEHEFKRMTWVEQQLYLAKQYQGDLWKLYLPITLAIPPLISIGLDVRRNDSYQEKCRRLVVNSQRRTFLSDAVFGFIWSHPERATVEEIEEAVQRMVDFQMANVDGVTLNQDAQEAWMNCVRSPEFAERSESLARALELFWCSPLKAHGEQVVTAQRDLQRTILDLYLNGLDLLEFPEGKSAKHALLDKSARVEVLELSPPVA